MPSITVEGLSPATTEKQITEFFSFCGKVQSVDLNASAHSATVTFEKPAAVKTALLLSDSELGGAKVKVSADEKTIADADADTPADTPGADQDISQEHKPKAAILAEYLSHGYVLGDQVIAKGLALDQKNGYSQKFLSFLTDLDSKYHVKDKAVATDNAYAISDTAKAQSSKLLKYFDQALESPTGSKLKSYYTDVVKNVTDVHNEARRLADLKKKEEAPAAAEAS